MGQSHRVSANVGLSFLQPPGWVVDVAPVDLMGAAYGVVSIAFGQPVFQRAGLGCERGVAGDCGRNNPGPVLNGL